MRDSTHGLSLPQEVMVRPPPHTSLPSFIDPCLDTSTPLPGTHGSGCCVGTTPCHPRNVSLVGRGYPAKTIGIGRFCAPPSLQDAALSLSSWSPGVPAEGWVVFLNANWYRVSKDLVYATPSFFLMSSFKAFLSAFPIFVSGMLSMNSTRSGS